MSEQYTEPTMQEIQAKLLEILRYYHVFCQTHGLRYTLAGGTCLGAVRHQGFIPWDDDVDVFMLREDYERLGALWAQYADTSRYSCVRSNDKVNIHHSATEIKDNNTTFINKHSVDLDIHQGLMIDVIPLDNVAASKPARLMQMIWAMIYCCYNFQRLPDHKSKLVYYRTKAALGVIRSPKLRYRIWKRAEQQVIRLGRKSSGDVASFGEGLTIMRQRFPSAWFEEPAYLSFEGIEMPVPKDYDRWLTVSYGDYMQYPPEEERVMRHNTAFIDLNRSYTCYKGIEYCKTPGNKKGTETWEY